MSEQMKRPDDFRMAFSSKPVGAASIYVGAFGREHIPFLRKALQVADEILAIEEECPPATPIKNEEGADPRPHGGGIGPY